MAIDSPPFGIAPSGYRLPPATRVGRVRLQVRDLQRSLEYYTQVLGLRTLVTNGGVAVLGAHGDPRALVELHERTDARPVPRHGLLGLYHFALLLPDRPSLGRFARHLANLGVHTASAGHAVSESIYLTDPDGLGVEVYADRPKNTWQVTGQELYITVEPLDLPDLVREGGLEPWIGSPAGTVVGHVHLYVGTLEHAEAFYHRALGFNKTAWTYPGALFFAAGGYHHHLGTNIWAAGAPRATDGDARLLEWELLLPGVDAIEEAARSLSDAGHEVIAEGADRLSADPWGTILRIRS